MKSITRAFILCAALFAGSALLGAPATGKGYHLSGVTGQVQGPILFHNWDVLVVSDEGEFVTHFLTDPDGSFTVDLKPGAYVLVAYITNVGSESLVFGTPVSVTVEKKQFARVVLPISLPPL